MDFDKIVIKSSPFIRCIMTAATIANQLDQAIVEIEPLASEILLATMYESNPIPLLEISKTKDIEVLKSKYKIPQNVYITKYDDFATDIQKHYPESKDRGMIRAFLA